MQEVTFEIYISSDEYLKLYRGAVQDVVTRALDGRTIRFPARVLQRFLLHDGVRGRFRIFFAPDGKFLGIEKLI